IKSEETVEDVENNKHEQKFMLKIDEFEYVVYYDQQRQLLYFFDKTYELILKRKNYEKQTDIAYIYLNNYEEISRNINHNVKSRLNSKVTETLNKWAEDYGFYIKRTSQVSFIGILTRSVLDNVEESKFEVLDEVRQLVVEEGQRNPV